jgi:hypothetical protein
MLNEVKAHAGRLVLFNQAEQMSDAASAAAVSAARAAAGEIQALVQRSEMPDGRGTARAILAQLEIVMSTYHRHARFLKEPAEINQGSFGEPYIAILHRLADISEHPPRGSHQSMWLRDDGDGPVLYTDHPDERRFAILTGKTDRLMKAIAGFGQAITQSRIHLSDPATSLRMDELGEELSQLRAEYSRFGQHETPPAHNYGNRWFLHFRQFLSPMTIGNRLVQGPNPANVASWPEADILFGLSTPDYVAAVTKRYNAYLPEDIYRIERALQSPTVPACIKKAVTAGFAVSSEFRSVISAFRGLTRQLTALSGVHWWAIVNYLVKVKPAQTAEGSAITFLAADSGVSGRPLEDTRSLLNMRRSDNEANRLLAELS